MDGNNNNETASVRANNSLVLKKENSSQKTVSIDFTMHYTGKSQVSQYSHQAAFNGNKTGDAFAFGRFVSCFALGHGATIILFEAIRYE
jgi:hypothetical protein